MSGMDETTIPEGLKQALEPIILDGHWNEEYEQWLPDDDAEQRIIDAALAWRDENGDTWVVPQARVVALATDLSKIMTDHLLVDRDRQIEALIAERSDLAERAATRIGEMQTKLTWAEARLVEVEAERDRWIETARTYCQNAAHWAARVEVLRHENEVLGAKIDELSTDNRRITAALRKYGKHDEDCPPWHDMACTCGFRAVLGSLPEETP